MAQTVLSGYSVVGTVRHTSSYGCAEITSHRRPQRKMPARLRPRNRAPGAAAVASPSHVPHGRDIGLDTDRATPGLLDAAARHNGVAPGTPAPGAGRTGRTRGRGRTGGRPA